jgi:hypothetical protein
MMSLDAIDPGEAISDKIGLVRGFLNSGGLLVDAVETPNEGIMAQCHVGSFNGERVVLESQFR